MSMRELRLKGAAMVACLAALLATQRCRREEPIQTQGQPPEPPGRVWAGMTEPDPGTGTIEIAESTYHTNLIIWTVGPTNLPPVRLLYLHSGPPTTRPWGTIQMWTEEAAERTNFGMWHYQWESPKRWDMLTGDQVDP